MKLLKIFCVLLLTYTVIAGFLFDVPKLAILNETIRVLYFHMEFSINHLFVFRPPHITPAR